MTNIASNMLLYLYYIAKNGFEFGGCQSFRLIWSFGPLVSRGVAPSLGDVSPSD